MEISEDENNELTLEQNNPSMVYTLDLSSRKLGEVPKSINKYKHCKSLNLSCNEISSIKKEDFSSFMQLKELKLYSNKLKLLNGLQHLEKLEALQLQFNCISSIEKSLKNNKNLLFLRLDSNNLTSITLSEICMLGRLTYIDISSNKLDDISCVNTLASLERLYCTHNCLAKLPNLSGLKKLKEVDFSSNLLVDISGLKSCNRLEIIIVDKNKIKNIIPVGNLRSLQELKISENLISDLKHICDQFNSLEVLEISGNKIDSFEQVKYLFKLSTLKELYIHDNHMLTDIEVKKMVFELLENNMQLEILDGKKLKKEKEVKPTACVMRPMSACHMITERSIKEQMEFSIMQMNDVENKIKLQYDVLKSSLMELPASKPALINKHINKHELKQRPHSRCSSRARLNEARAFAEKHFEAEE